LSQAIALAENVVLTIALEPSDLRAGERPGGTGGSAVLSTDRGLSYLRPHRGCRSRAFNPIASGFAQSAKSVGHTLAPADPDGVIRRVPLFVRDR